MYYLPEMRMICNAFEKCHINTAVITKSEDLTKKLDIAIYKLLKNSQDKPFTVNDLISPLTPATVYRFTDMFSCGYIFFLLPGTEEKVFIIGPFVNSPPTSNQIIEWLEKYSVNAQKRKALEEYYAAIPILKDSSHLYVLLESFYEVLWSANGFKYSDLNRDYLEQIFSLRKPNQQNEENDTLFEMQVMEKRYAFENELMNAVSNGHIGKAEFIMSKISDFPFENRVPDQLRNLKNYCIIMNTLLRKAAENGGVHPIYIDSISADFAVRIEKSNSLSTVKALMEEMLRSYCRLVKKHTMRNYSSPIQKAIACIDSDLTADLSLNRLAGLQNLSASYLSSLFKKETGVTLTEYVNKKRIKYAKQLLATTKIQVQTAAQHCGIDDVHYFTKLFKKYTGKTPKEYRQSIIN